MNEAEFAHWLQEGGQVVVPRRLLEYMQGLNLSPENLGYLVLALAKSQQYIKKGELASDPWIKWAFSQGWVTWEGQGEGQRLTFKPLWNSLYSKWKEDASPRQEKPATSRGSFDYNKILKWLDQVRGTLSVTMREKQVLQEFNLKYGWSGEFILIFLQLAFERGHNQVHSYLPVAKKVFESGINTVNGLISFMNDLDWTQYKVAEVKACIGQYGGVTRPQREMYLKWNREWRFGHELIMRAAQETVGTNNPSFKYIDGILHNWHQQGIGDLETAEKQLRAFNSAPQAVKRSGGRKRINLPDQRDLKKLYGLE